MCRRCTNSWSNIRHRKPSAAKLLSISAPAVLARVHVAEAKPSASLTLSIGVMHGYGIAQHIQMLSADVLTIEEGSLYPALQRMLVKRWVVAEWKISANNRRARFYRLTTAGKKQLGVEESRFSQMFGAIMRVMKTT